MYSSGFALSFDRAPYLALVLSNDWDDMANQGPPRYKLDALTS